MSRVAKDLKDSVFGRLTVLSRKGIDKFNHSLWECKCECGNIKILSSCSLTTGNTRSCGCLHRDAVIDRNKKTSTTHGFCVGANRPSIYAAWCDMKQRCYNRKHKSYELYGGRGIIVCDRWLHSFENFFEDIGEKPGNGYSLDRIDSNGNYESKNCRWATLSEQNKNRRPFTIGKPKYVSF